MTLGSQKFITTREKELCFSKSFYFRLTEISIHVLINLQCVSLCMTQPPTQAPIVQCREPCVPMKHSIQFNLPKQEQSYLWMSLWSSYVYNSHFNVLLCEVVARPSHFNVVKFTPKKFFRENCFHPLFLRNYQIKIPCCCFNIQYFNSKYSTLI